MTTIPEKDVYMEGAIRALSPVSVSEIETSIIHFLYSSPRPDAEDLSRMDLGTRVDHDT